MTTWKDETTYRRGDKQRTPRVWTVMLAGVQFSVHRRYTDTDHWFLSGGEFDGSSLEATDVGAAKAEALKRIGEVYEAVAHAAQGTIV